MIELTYKLERISSQGRNLKFYSLKEKNNTMSSKHCL